MTQDKDYVVLKLITGETVMAMFHGEDEKYIRVDYPVQIRTVMIPGINRETVHAAPFCQFSDSTAFVLEKNHIVYIKKLHHQFVSHYKNFLKSYDEALIPATRGNVDMEALEDAFDDLEDLTLEEVNRRLDMLEAIANAPSSKDEESNVTIVEGNDTIH